MASVLIEAVSHNFVWSSICRHGIVANLSAMSALPEPPPPMLARTNLCCASVFSVLILSLAACRARRAHHLSAFVMASRTCLVNSASRL